MPLLLLADRLALGLPSLPWWSHVPVALALVAGLILWLVGRKVLRPVSILMGLAVGGLLGFLLLPTAVPSVSISPYIGIVGGATSGLVVALLVSHVVSAATFGASLGAGCGLLTAAVLGTGLSLPAAVSTVDQQAAQNAPAPAAPEPPPWGTGIGGGEQPVYIPPQAIPPPALPALDEPLDEGPDPADVEAPASKPASKPKPPAPAKPSKPRPAPQHELDDASSAGVLDAEGVADAAAKARSTWRALRGEWQDWWSDRNARQRWWISAAAGVGLVCGTLLGLLMPAWSAGAATALVGSAIWLPAAAWLGQAFRVPVIATLSLPMLGWLLVWGAAAMVGVAAQWYGLIPVRETKGKRRKARPDDAE